MLLYNPNYVTLQRFNTTTTPIHVTDKVLSILSKPTPAVDVNDIAYLLKCYSFMVNI